MSFTDVAESPFDLRHALFEAIETSSQGSDLSGQRGPVKIVGRDHITPRAFNRGCDATSLQVTYGVPSDLSSDAISLSELRQGRQLRTYAELTLANPTFQSNCYRSVCGQFRLHVRQCRSLATTSNPMSDLGWTAYQLCDTVQPCHTVNTVEARPNKEELMSDPTPSDLLAIEAEWPLIAAELALVA